MLEIVHLWRVGAKLICRRDQNKNLFKRGRWNFENL